MNKRKLLQFGYNWITQFCDPLQTARGLKGLFRYTADYRTYKKKAGSRSVHLLDTLPVFHQFYGTHELDAHYFYVNAWAIRRIQASHPERHIDIASQLVFASLLSAVIPVTYVDYRPLEVNLDNLDCVSGDILNLPYEDNSIESLSCLHVAEHIGLGRYGEPLDPEGSKKAALELKRILAPQGNLFFAVPVGLPRVCFNAHRVHSAETIRDYFAGLELIEYSGVNDGGDFVEKVKLSEFLDSEYALGMFWFKKNI